jgi:Leucine-rich repeat (LRR) protein
MKLELFINHKKTSVDVECDGKEINLTGTNTNITSLEGLPPTLTTLYISRNSITSLEGLPPTLTTLYISRNRITSLEGLPPTLTTLYISYNQITSLEGLPPTLTELYISNNQITSLEGLPPTLTTLYISCNRITSLAGLPPTLTTLYISYNQISSLEGLPSTLTKLDISDNRITSLEGLPPTLTKLYISNNQITSLEGLPPTLTTLYISCNRITSLAGLPPTLTKLDISDNRITSLEGLPPTLTVLDISDNQITSLPISLVHLRNLHRFHYSGNPIELGGIHPSVQRFLNNIGNRPARQGATIYDDGQNVHNIVVQNSIRESLNKLTTYPQQLMISNLAKEEYEFLNSEEGHSFFHFTQKEVLLFVENAICLCKDDVKSELYSLLKEALREGRNVCSTGRIGRLVNVLSGFDDNVQIKISQNSQIGAIVSKFRERGELKEKVEEELRSRGIEKEEISEWLEYY